MPTLKAIEIGNQFEDHVVMGQTYQLTATGYYDDYSTADLTSSVTWSSDNSSRLPVSSGGLLSTSGSYKAKAVITASFSGVSTTKTYTSEYQAFVGYNFFPNLFNVGNVQQVRVYRYKLAQGEFTQNTLQYNDGSIGTIQQGEMLGIDITSTVTGWALLVGSVAANPANYTLTSGGVLTCVSLAGSGPDVLNISVTDPSTSATVQSGDMYCGRAATTTDTLYIETFNHRGRLQNYGSGGTPAPHGPNTWAHIRVQDTSGSLIGFKPTTVTSSNSSVIEILSSDPLLSGNSDSGVFTMVAKARGSATITASATVNGHALTTNATLRVVEPMDVNYAATGTTTPLSPMSGEQWRGDLTVANWTFDGSTSSDSSIQGYYLPYTYWIHSDAPSVANLLPPVYVQYSNLPYPPICCLSTGTANITAKLFPYNGHDYAHCLLRSVLGTASQSFTVQVQGQARVAIDHYVGYYGAQSCDDDTSPLAISIYEGVATCYNTFEVSGSTSPVTVISLSADTFYVDITGRDVHNAVITERLNFAGVSTMTTTHSFAKIDSAECNVDPTTGPSRVGDATALLGAQVYTGTVVSATVEDDITFNSSATSGYITSAHQITLGSDASSVDDAYVGMIVVGLSGTSAGTFASVTKYNGSTKVLHFDNWLGYFVPDNTTVIGIYRGYMLTDFNGAYLRPLFSNVSHPTTGTRKYYASTQFIATRPGYLNQVSVKVTDPTGALRWGFDFPPYSTPANRLTAPTNIEWFTSDITTGPWQMNPNTGVSLWFELTLTSTTHIDFSRIRVEVYI